MKTIKIYNHASIDDRVQLKLDNDSGMFYSALWEFKEYIRRVDKHQSYPDEAQNMLEEIRDKFLEVIESIDWDRYEYGYLYS